MRAHKSLLYLLGLFSLSVFDLFANPQKPNIVTGNALISDVEENTLNIIANDKTIINWEKFSIQQNELTRFILPSNASAVLNRVTGIEISSILGRLESNGKILLLNPNGLYIGKEAVIKTASFIGSTFDVLNEAFLQNQDLLFQGDSKEAIINLGTIETIDGDAVLLARFVKNTGDIKSNGDVLIGAGKEILLKLDGQDKMFIRPSREIFEETDTYENPSEKTGIDNQGYIEAVHAELKADGSLYNLAIQNSGKIDALGVEKRNGEIFLVAEGGDVFLENSQLIAKNEKSSVSELGIPESDIEKEITGGTIRILGKKVGLFEENIFDVSGDFNGGEILIGGDYQGNNPKIPNADAIYISEDSKLYADADISGNGGKIICWSNNCTRMYGFASARGGENAGDGGLIEVSGEWLEFTGNVNTLAPHGKAGTLLLDPYNLEIGSGGDSNVDGLPSGPTFEPNNTSAVLNVSTLTTALESADIIVRTVQGVVEAGNINFTGGSIAPASGSSNLTIQASGGFQAGVGTSMTLLGNLEITATNGNIIFQGTLVTGDVFSAAGNITLTASAGNVVQILDCTVQSTGGDISITAPNALQIWSHGATTLLTTASHNINVSAGGLFIDGSAAGAYSASMTTTTSGNIEITITSGAGGECLFLGGDVSNSAAYIAAAGSVTLSGRGNITLLGGQDVGTDSTAYITNLTQISTTTGSLYVTGGAASGNYASITSSSGLVFDGIAGNLQLQGGSASGAYAEIDVTGAISMGTNKKIAGNLVLHGGSAANTFAKIVATSDITLDVTGSAVSDIILDGGSGVSNSYASITAGGNITLSSGRDIDLNGGSGAASSSAQISTSSGYVNLTVGRSLSLTGGTVSADNIANISSTTSSTYLIGHDVDLQANAALCSLSNIGSLTTTAGNVTLTGGSDTDAYSRITNSVGDADLSIGGNLTLIGGSAGSGNYAKIDTGNYNLTLGVSGNVTLNGGTGGTGNYSSIESSSGIILNDITGNLSVLGSAFSGNYAKISAATMAMGASQTIGGNVTLTGSSAANTYASMETSSTMSLDITGNIAMTAGSAGAGTTYARIQSGGAMTLAMHSGTIDVNGGSGGTGNYGRIYTSAGALSITNAGLVTLDGGTVDSGNSALIEGAGNVTLSTSDSVTLTGKVGNATINKLNSLTITGAHNLSLVGSTTAGGNGVAYVNIDGADPSISIGGALNLTGGDQTDAYAEFSSATQDFTINAESISLQGDTNPAAGTGCYASIKTTAANHNITLVTTGAISLTGGDEDSSNIASIAPNGSGMVTINSGGNVGVNGGVIAPSYITNLDQITITGGANLNVIAGFEGNAYIDVVGNNHLLSIGGAVNIFGSGGYARLTSSTNDITITAASVSLIGGPAADAKISNSNYNISITTTGNVSLLGQVEEASVETTGSGVVTFPSVGGNVSLQGGSGGGSGAAYIASLTSLTATGDVSITAGSNDTAYISGSSSSNMTLTLRNLSITGSSDLGGYAQITSLNNRDITINPSGTVTLLGGDSLVTDIAAIEPHGTGVVTIVSAGGNISVTGGAIAPAYIHKLQTLTFSGTHALSIVGSTTGAGYAEITLNGTTPSLTITGSLNITGGTGTNAYAKLTGAEDFAIDVGAIALQGGSAGTGNTATLETSADHSIDISSASISILGGSASNTNYAAIVPNGTGTVTIVAAGNVGLVGSAAPAYISNLSSLNTLVYALTLQGGTGTDAYALVSNSASDMSLLNLSQLLLTGGSAGTGNYAKITTTGGYDITSITTSGVITLTGGDVVGGGNTNDAAIDPGTGHILSFTAADNMTLTGKGANSYIHKLQTLSISGSHNLSINGSTTALSNGYAEVTVDGTTPSLTIGGDLNITGGSQTSAYAKLTGAEDFAIDVGAIVLQGGSAGTGNTATLETSANHTIDISSASISILGGAASNTNYAAIAPNGTGTVTIVAAGNVGLVGAAAPAYISNLSSLNTLVYALTLQGGTGTDAYALVSNSASDMSLLNISQLLLTGGSAGTGNYAKISTTGGYDITSILTSREIILTGGSASNTNYAAIIPSGTVNITQAGSVAITASTAPAYITNLSALTSLGNVTLTAAAQNAYIQTSSTPLDITGNLILNGDVGAAQILGTTEDLLINVSDSVLLQGDALISSGGSLLRIIAGNNIQLLNGSSGNPTIQNTAGDVTLVVDNDYPTSPLLGTGKFIMESTGVISSFGSINLRIFTSARGYNQIFGLLNGVNFVSSGTEYNTPQERWGTYYPSTYFGGPNYTIFYKPDAATYVFYIGYMSFLSLATADFMTLVDDTINKWKILDLYERYMQRSRVWNVRFEDFPKSNREFLEVMKLPIN